MCCVVVIVIVFFCVFFSGSCGVTMSVRVGVMARFLPAVTVGVIPTVFVGWVVGLVCKKSYLLEFFAFFICDIVVGFKS